MGFQQQYRIVNVILNESMSAAIKYIRHMPMELRMPNFAICK